MKKSELYGELIKFAEQDQQTLSETITMDYLVYLKKIKRLLEIGDIEI